MEKGIKKEVFRLVSAVSVVVFGYWLLLSPNGYWQRRAREADEKEYSEKRLLWRKSETMTMQRMLQDLTLLANGDSVMVCEACHRALPVYRDFIHASAQPKRSAWVNLRYRYGRYLTKSREEMLRVARDRNNKSIVFWSERRLEEQKDSTTDYRKGKPTHTETLYNKVYPELGKPACLTEIVCLSKADSLFRLLKADLLRRELTQILTAHRTRCGVTFCNTASLLLCGVRSIC